MTATRQIYQHPSAWKPAELGSKAAITEALNDQHIEVFDQALHAVLETPPPLK